MAIFQTLESNNRLTGWYERSPKFSFWHHQLIITWCKVWSHLLLTLSEQKRTKLVGNHCWPITIWVTWHPLLPPALAGVRAKSKHQGQKEPGKSAEHILAAQHFTVPWLLSWLCTKGWELAGFFFFISKIWIILCFMELFKDRIYKVSGTVSD